MPWLATSESMHYFYAIYTLAGLVLLLPAIEGQARFWWSASLLFQLWHHFEHATLLVQSVSGQYYFGESMPVSIVQTLIPRVELHLMYNTLVFVPMVIAIIIHFYPSAAEQQELICDCSPRTRQGLVVSKGAV